MPLGRTVLGTASAYAAGQRDRYVTLQQVTASVGSDGFPVETWTTLGNVWASRLDLTGDEQFGANQNSAFGQARWHLEYREDMDPETVDVPAARRLSYAGRVYDILTASVIDWRKAIELITLVKADA